MSMPNDGGTPVAPPQDPQMTPPVAQAQQPLPPPQGHQQQTLSPPPRKSGWRRYLAIAMWPWPMVGRCLLRKAKRAPAWSVGAAIAILAVTFIFRQPIWDYITGTENGKIIVNSPTVYTRQRLVNDRLDQAHWLRTQLKPTEIGQDQHFKSIDQVRRTFSNTRLSFGSSATPSRTEAVTDNSNITPTGNDGVRRGTQEDSRNVATTEAIHVDSTTTALFRAKNSYREEVRSEITQTELDDRHDIDGNTIYRLTFDAAVLAGTRRDSIAAIGVRLSHEPISSTTIPQIYDADYRSLYQDWIEYFQRTIRKSLVSITRSLLTPAPHAPMRLLFSEFLQRRICQMLTEGRDVNDFINHTPPQCSGTDSGAVRKRADDLLKEFTLKRANALAISRKSRFYDELEFFRTRNEFAILNPDRDFLYHLAVSACQASPLGDRIPVSNISITGPQNKPTLEIGCPFYDGLKERLLAGILLYEKLLSMPQKDRLDLAKPDSDLTGCLNKDCDASPTILKCFTADFLKSNLDLFQNPKALPQQKISRFLRLEIVGRNVDSCDLLVKGEIERYKNPEEIGRHDSGVSRPKGQTQAGKQKDDPNNVTREASAAADRLVSEGRLLEFIKLLNGGTDAFAYSVTPKNLTENISTASDTRDAYSAIVRQNGQGNEIGGLLRDRSEQNHAIVTHPIVVGFGSGRDFNAEPNISGVRRLEFGWVVAPRSRPKKLYEQIDGQYPLTAFISVPAWWRTVEVTIRSCWLPRHVLSGAELDQAASKICDHNNQVRTSNIIVRLPPAIPEISRKLGFDVVQQPSLYNPAPKELIIGTPGSLLLEGARLWRSTEVTAGAQKADRITVLPNMEGILAEFDCVHPPTGIRRLRQNLEDLSFQTVTYDTVQVWTSEGVTDPLQVAFVWPNETKDYLKVNLLCPETRPKSVAPSTTPIFVTIPTPAPPTAPPTETAPPTPPPTETGPPAN